MKFGITNKERHDKMSQFTAWHKHFVVYINIDGRHIFFETIERRLNEIIWGGWGKIHWEYRLPPK